MAKYKNDLRCSFCGKTQDEVRKLIAGPEGVFICNECVDICVGIVEEEYEFLDSVEFEGNTYFMLIPATDDEEIDGEVFIMKLVELDGEEMLEGIDDGELFDKIYMISIYFIA